MLKLASSLLGTVHDAIGNAAHARTVHAKTAVGHAILESVQIIDAASGVVDVNLHAAGTHLRVAGEFRCERVVMRRKEANATDMGGDVVEHSLGDGETVVGAGAAAEFVEDDERARRGFTENLFGFRQFDKESRLGCKNVVIGPEP